MNVNTLLNWFSDSTLEQLGCPFQESFSMPDPTGLSVSTSYKSGECGSLPKQGKKDNSYCRLIFETRSAC